VGDIQETFFLVLTAQIKRLERLDFSIHVESSVEISFLSSDFAIFVDISQLRSFLIC